MFRTLRIARHQHFLPFGQAERQRLDGLRTRWQAETRRKSKARDAEKRAAAEKAKTREKADTEDLLTR